MSIFLLLVLEFVLKLRFPVSVLCNYLKTIPKVLQPSINKIRNFDLDWFSKDTESPLLREEDHVSIHTKQRKVLILKYYPTLSIHMTFMRPFVA